MTQINRDTDIFITNKELGNATKEFNESLVLLRDTVTKITDSIQKSADKIQALVAHSLELLK